MHDTSSRIEDVHGDRMALKVECFNIGDSMISVLPSKYVYMLQKCTVALMHKRGHENTWRSPLSLVITWAWKLL